jgi:arylsulfatase A-like enzyme
MKKRPNVLWLMSDQHNARCAGYMGHPDVKTPNLDRVANHGVNFVNGFANNPICSPSRICYMTGRYMHSHRMFGNNHAEYPKSNPDTMACRFRRQGYQTGLFGKSHMIRRWDEDGFERIRYTDLCDSKRNDPRTTHYFQYLVDNDLGHLYEEGSPREETMFTMDGSAPSRLPYEHSIEHFTGNETLKFLEERDESRPFYIHMSFQRPHAPIAPAAEYFDMYDPDKITLPDSMGDYFENKFASKSPVIRDRVKDGCEYPMADEDEKRLRRCIASYYALISCIDMEIGRILDYLEEVGELDNTIVYYTADHGDFAGEHGLFHKNLGLYDSIHRTPYLLSYPGSPQGVVHEAFAESVDLYPTLCELCDVPEPDCLDGKSLIPVINGEVPGKTEAYCEWVWFNPDTKISAVCDKYYRLMYFAALGYGEFYDLQKDPGEINNLWDDPEYTVPKMEMLQKLLSFTLEYETETDVYTDQLEEADSCNAPSRLMHKYMRRWPEVQAMCPGLNE